ncbi:16S rRNA (cytosine(967)-C(5))-methyltransferase RsmB [Methylibium petroleiphilum]|uniref:16S rRNA (cytosine(967)-C(5))-methyltransferase RsmB n=1 Tax=Methylibium petroleiphilum TaxID=105560 RepID=UPI001AC946DE|nr:16S rRNA (cytosine(967)-C(5))-methyltransferase RsmB [Methylibium petroleiphilum]MBN9204938.1 16S rRNA (cytosine(967)-C(5))-methyltransferase RsmB [Methylibium petroleiphilum]
MSAPAPPSLPLATLLAHTADAVAAVCAGRSLTDALATVPAAPRPGTQALAFRVLRGLGLARALRRQLVPKAPPAWVDALLLSALALSHQDSESVDTPPYAPHTLVSQAVEAAKQRARAQAGLVNAVLRRHLREQATQAAAAAKDPVAVWNHPRWWIETLQRDWPGQWAELLRANDRRAPMTLRVNQRQQDRAGYLLRLEQAGIAAHAVARPGATDAQAIELATPCAVSALPGFADGAVSVQDLAAQVAAPLLLGAGLAPGARVLDACAAPGGKTAHLLELAELDLLALDADPRRLVKVNETLQRLGLRARTQAADARDVAVWWDGRPYDAILLDAPCSASGIVRRHPDVRWLRRASDLDALASTQAALLDALWPLLRPGGRLLYATCSVFKAEGVYQIDAFLQRAPDAIEQPSPGYLLPVVDNPEQVSERPLRPSTDGFYYALLEKRSS